MGKIFKKLTLRTIISNFRQFLSVILIVFLASMLMSGFLSNYSMLNICIDTYFEKTNLADCWLDVSAISSQDEAFFKGEDELFKEYRKYFKSDEIRYSKRLYFEAPLKIKDSAASNNGKVYIYDGRISNPYKETGAWGCVIDKTVAENHKINIGYDEVQFVYDYYYEGKFYEIEMSFLVTGTMSLDECADFESAWPIFVTEEAFLLTLNNRLDFLEIDINNGLVDGGANSQSGSGTGSQDGGLGNDLGIGVGDSGNDLGSGTLNGASGVGSQGDFHFEDVAVVPYNQVLISVKDSYLYDKEQKLQSFITAAKIYYEDESENELLYCLTRDSVESVVKLKSEVEQAKKMIYVFPVFFLLVSILIILTTIDQLVMQERQKIGTLKSVGVPDGVIFKHYSRYGAILCAIGSVLGVLFGVLVIPGIMFIKYRMVYSIPNDYIILKVPFFWLILVVAGITLLGYIVSMVACRSILKKRAIECLKFQINNTKAFKKGGFDWVKRTPFSIRMALRNIRLKPIRTIMAIIGIAGCISMLICGYGIKDTLNNSMYYDFEKTLKYDISTTYTKEDFEQKLTSLDGVKLYELYEKLYVRASSDSLEKNTNIYVIPANSYILKIRIESGECFVSKSVAEEFNVSVGDKITITLGDVQKQITVSKIGVTSSHNSIYICDDLGFDDDYKIKGAWINCGGVTEEKLKYVNSINGTNTAKTMQEAIDSIKQRISTTTVMTEAIKFYAISLAIVVLLNLIFLIIKERIREIATMKVLGRDLVSILLSLFFEIIFMGLLGSIIGIMFGYPMLMLVLSINKVDNLNFIYKIGFSSFVSSFFVVISTILIMMLLCYYKVKNISMTDSLKSSE